MARKYPSELNTRTIRIGTGDYASLMELSESTHVTVAEAFHQLLEGRQQVVKQPMPREQMSMLNLEKQ